MGRAILTAGALIGIAVLLGIVIGRGLVKAIQPPDLSWETENANDRSLINAHPQLTIRPTKFPSNSSWRTVWSPTGKCLGIKMQPADVIKFAHLGKAFFDPISVLTITNVDLPTNYYDFICNLPHGSSNALQEAVDERFGISARFENMRTNVLNLKVSEAGIKGMLPVKNKKPFSDGRRRYSVTGQSMKSFAGHMSQVLNIPVLDETGLTNDFIINFHGLRLTGNHQPPSVAAVNQALLDELGLELKPDMAPVKMFVIDKAK